MSDQKSSNLLFLAIGAAVGAAIGYIVASDKKDEYLKEVLDFADTVKSTVKAKLENINCHAKSSTEEVSQGEPRA